ncbi:MAG: glutamate racemase [Rhodospirillales bacterium]|nr:glutamate racemase [Rhodospirillales bacterium]
MSDSPNQSPARPHALVFDSGVGGLSVMREIAALLPQIRLTYAADNAAFPYGTKTESELVARVSAVIGTLVDTIAPDIVVIACNTASTTALEAVRKFLKVPVIGVVPAVKPAAAASQSRVIGLLGTRATVASPYTATLIAQFAACCTVLTHGSPELVEAAERKMQGLPVDMVEIASVLQRLFGQPGGDRLDTIVLGCTHFPLLGAELVAAAAHPVAWMDSGAAIARRVAAMLGPIEPAALSYRPAHRAIFTAESQAVDRMRGCLATFGLREIGFLEPTPYAEPNYRQDRA